MHSRIIGSSYELPQRIINNNTLVNLYEEPYLKKYGKALSEETIYKACGIEERRYLTASERLRDLGANCIINLLKETNTSLSDIDAIIISNSAPESITPSNANLIFAEVAKYYNELDLKMTTYDVNSACSGFLFALEQADNYIRLGKKKKIIVCAVEAISRLLNNFDYHTGILFGDGAGAFLLEASNDQGILHTDSICVTDNISDIVCYSHLSKEKDKSLNLEGYKVYRNGTALTINYIKKYLTSKNFKIQDFDYVICHQANARMLRTISKALNIPQHKMLTNIKYVGNTASASIPICFAQNEKMFKSGNRILLCSFGAGYSLGLTDLIW